MKEELKKVGESNLPNLITKVEASKYFKVSVPTIRNWVDAGTLKEVKFGRRVYIVVDHIQERVSN